MLRSVPRAMISAAASGSGKTCVVCGILKALKTQGMEVSAFKCGPDYIDPMFHTKAIGVSSKNLDGFFCDEQLLKKLFLKQAKKSEISIMEGVMGYYDGLSMDSYRASSYEIAVNTKTPVILVLNARGAALTIVPLIKGIMDFRPDSNIKGIILNNVSRHVYEGLKKVIEEQLGIKALGYMPYSEEIAIESRHLGLVTPDSAEDINIKLEGLGKIAEKCIDLEGIISVARAAEPLDVADTEVFFAKKRVKIGVAYDNAFCFYYRDNIELLEKMGCEIVYFSPLKDKEIPPQVSGIILGGGYPELYCRELSENRSMLESIRKNLEGGMPCLAECGGFMYLHNTMEDKDGVSYPMAGVVDGAALKKNRLVRFGYATLCAQTDSFVLKKGEKIKAHEFHYWDSTSNGNAFVAQKPNGKIWECMHCYKNVVCGYPHIFYYSNIEYAQGFADKCVEYKGRCNNLAARDK